jgi:hypothetical protein
LRRWRLGVGVIWWRDADFARLPRLLLTRMAMKVFFVSCFSYVLWWPDLFVGAVDSGGYED